MNEAGEIGSVLSGLRRHVEAEGFRGYDPYDVLLSPFVRLLPGRLLPALAIQLQKRSPVNFRPMLGIRKEINPKAMGLFLSSYALLAEMDREERAAKTAEHLFRWLSENVSRGYSGCCWGYNFDWASPGKYLRAHTPSVVVTAFVSKGMFAYHRATGDGKAAEILRSSCDFVLKDLPVTETADGLCFSYTPLQKDCCYNANMLAAEVLAMGYALTGEQALRERAMKAVDFTLAHQKPDGRWNYSIDLQTGRERPQVDFHQGFILDSLRAVMDCTGISDGKIEKALRKGADFYRKEQFFENGRSRWRLPKVWPVDIHNQAQGILTFSGLGTLDESYPRFAGTIARWTTSNMLDRDGFFQYRKTRLFTNSIPYIRWSQAWMMRALVSLLISGRGNA